MKPVDVSTFIDFGIENNGKYPVPDVGNVRKSKFKKNLDKVTLQIGLEKFLWSKTFKILCHGYTNRDFHGEVIVGTFYEKKNRKRQIRKCNKE